MVTCILNLISTFLIFLTFSDSIFCDSTICLVCSVSRSICVLCYPHCSEIHPDFYYTYISMYCTVYCTFYVNFLILYPPCSIILSLLYFATAVSLNLPVLAVSYTELSSIYHLLLCIEYYTRICCYYRVGVTVHPRVYITNPLCYVLILDPGG